MFDITLANNKWPSILMSLGVDECFLKNRMGPCPFCGGRDRYRFTNLNGEGMWFCNKEGAGNGYHFVMRHRQVDFKEAIKLVSEIIPSATEVKQKKTDRSAFLQKIWRGSSSIIRGDEVYRYLTGRGIPLSEFPSDVRCHPSINYYEEKKKIGTFAAMVAMVRDATGKPKTLHVTYIKDGVKAPVPSPKKILSECPPGCSIRLFEPSEVLCVTEGIETALAVRNKTNKPVWSLLNANNLRQFQLPDGVRRVEVWADNDVSYTGQSAAYALANKLATHGIDVDVFLPERGTDWADQK